MPRVSCHCQMAREALGGDFLPPGRDRDLGSLRDVPSSWGGGRSRQEAWAATDVSREGSLLTAGRLGLAAQPPRRGGRATGRCARRGYSPSRGPSSGQHKAVSSQEGRP